MVEQVSVGQNKTITTADFCNTDSWGLGVNAAIEAFAGTESIVRAACSKTNKRAEAGALAFYWDPVLTAIAEVGQTIEIDGNPSSGQQLKVGFDGSYDALSLLAGTSSNFIKIVSFIADEEVNNPIKRHFYLDITGAVIDGRPFQGQIDPTKNELYLDADQMSDGDRFVVGVAAKVSTGAVGKAFASGDVESDSNSDELSFDGQVSYDNIELSWT